MTVDPPPKVLEVARAAAQAKGWPWLEPVDIELQSVSGATRVWQVRTNRHGRGLNARILVSEPDFVVVSAAFLPR